MTLGVGDRFPQFALVTATGRDLAPVDLAGRAAVFFFYPKADTPGCTKEALAFTALSDRFAEAGTALIGVSRDAPAALERFAQKHALNVTLASDTGADPLSDRLGIWREKVNYGRRYMGMVRSTYLVDTDTIVRRIWSPVRVPGHAEAVLEAAQILATDIIGPSKAGYAAGTD